MSRFIIGSRAELVAALRAQEAPLAAAWWRRAAAIAGADAASAALASQRWALRADFDAARATFDATREATAAVRAALSVQAALRFRLERELALLTAERVPLDERGRAVAEDLFLDALFIVAQFPGGQIAEADKCCYAFDVRACAGLCRATWAEEALWSGLVRVRAGPGERTRLMYAAAHGDAARVAWLLARGAPREARDVRGTTALFFASSKGHADAVRALLAAGANVDASNNNGVTPLWTAAYSGHTDAVRALLTASADVEGAFNHGYRPLHAASLHDHVAAATLLLDAGAGVNARYNGHTPLAWASTPEMRALLVARGGV
jgi:hypothetical protein